MSLTSRITNLASDSTSPHDRLYSTTSKHDAPRNNSNEHAKGDGVQNRSSVLTGIMAQDNFEEEQEARPPYLHVCTTS